MAHRDRARLPVLIPPRTPAETRADAPDSFAAIAETVPPVVWKFPDFYEEVTSPDSALHALISGDVRDVACYLYGYKQHLLMRVHIQNQRVPIVCLRAERQSDSSLGTIQFSANRSNLQEPRYDYTMTTTFATLNFRHVIDLFNNINVVPADFIYPWWWAFINFGMLHQGFRGSWLQLPSPGWLKSRLEGFERCAASIEYTQRQFAIQYPTARKISLRDPERWKNEPASPSQAADLTLGPEIVHIGSAPTLPEEHLQRPRPLQSPNANGAVPAPATDTEKNGGELPQGREINRSKVLAPKPLKSPNRHDPHRSSISRIRKPLSGQTDERQPVQPANPSSTPAPPTLVSTKEPSTGIDEATSILQGVVITAPSTEPLEPGPDANSPFPNPQPSPPETPDLTGRIVRLGSTPMATGGYSSVWRGSLLSASPDPDQGLQVAIKILRASYTDEVTLKRKLHKRLHVEMRIWAQLRHENVVRLLGHTEEPEGPGLVSISYLHGNVLSFLAKNPNINREIICADVALGLQYLHEHVPPIIHGDLKGPNVLIDAEGRASICDFGLSIILDGHPTGHTSSNFGGSLRFLAPELLEESTRTVETDIYAYACTCIAILFDQEPYHQLAKEAHILSAIWSHQPPFKPANKDGTFPSVLEVLERCWSHDRWSRPSVDLIIDTLQRCLYRTHQTNLGVHQGIGRRVRFMCVPEIEEAKLISVADDGLSIVVKSLSSLHRVPIYQRYRWELMDRRDFKDSEDDSEVSWLLRAIHQYSPFTAFTSLMGKFASSSEPPTYVSKWKDYSAKFRLPYSLMVSYEPYNEATSETVQRPPPEFSTGIGPGRDVLEVESQGPYPQPPFLTTTHFLS